MDKREWWPDGWIFDKANIANVKGRIYVYDMGDHCIIMYIEIFHNKMLREMNKIVVSPPMSLQYSEGITQAITIEYCKSTLA